MSTVPLGVASASAQGTGGTGTAPASLNSGAAVPAAVTPAASAAATLCAKVAAKAGFSYTANVSTAAGNVRQIVVAVAVAMAESSCNPSATGQNPGSVDRG
ncbi:MAG: hypothetical protein J2P15_17985, partial [Micromonosporaceae bacterium]|nr:hypothetical protein [Micromonosporaceae bacterium]